MVEASFRAPDRLSLALDAYETRRGDFADYVIHEDGQSAGCSHTATFDRALGREPGFVSP